MDLPLVLKVKVKSSRRKKRDSEIKKGLTGNQKKKKKIQSCYDLTNPNNFRYQLTNKFKYKCSNKQLIIPNS